MHKNSKVNEKLIVQPVFVSLMHQHRFMGPCRYGFGEELSYEFDHNAAEKDWQNLILKSQKMSIRILW